MSSTLEIRALSKRFGSLRALDAVSLSLRAGEVHCLLGENGAGKTTLCNLIFGVHQPDGGELLMNGGAFRPRSPAHALAHGVAMVHQHFSLVGNLTGLENLRLGRKLPKAQIAQRVAELGELYGFEVDLTRPTEELAVGERQRLEIVKCLLSEPRLLVLDEPTAVLPPAEVAGLLALCRRIVEGGCAILMVTHKLAEIAQIADRVSVMRRGQLVLTTRMDETDVDALVHAMIGRELSPLGIARTPRTHEGPAALELEALTLGDRLHVSLRVAPGEIVALAGVEGNGQRELGMILSGLWKPTSGVVRLPDGVGVVPEDRHAVGCHVRLSVGENLWLSQLAKFTRLGFLRRSALRAASLPLLRAFDVRGEVDDPMFALSGGNQQKVVLARELSVPGLRFLLAAQPTRGLDAGAVQSVYREIARVRDAGVGVLLISSELDELLAVADRVLVIYRGRIVGELPGGADQQQAVGRLMSGQEAA
jgi:ABC-type uncharacterized transport system ATPase subunit